MRPGSSWVALARRAAASFRSQGDAIGLYRSLCLLSGQTDGVVHPPERRASEALLLSLQAHLPTPEIEKLWREGANWTEDEAFARIGLA
jgi:hypothetical protein